MDEKPIVTKEGFSAVQGCLIAAVVLFILLLGVSIVLGYRQFREHTGDPAASAVVDTAGHRAATAGAGPRILSS